ncbi:penicillin acylase family protein [Kibdelosporangium philippinense]|uniref:Penicillin acylase family protein n=1 Tax=Kibdelosporangium philippinense TaxID=211113 RepID=A0ABS8ZNP6_9PSEU|nr:penicillin acylase family protein [Kibdelosporangium philippinense]MCE7009383.1 penicillin acylase family protein [Kibdelosporangium philippinense]
MLTSLAVALTVATGAVAPVSSGITIRYTEYDIPHIVAHDYRSLGYGQGYAAARANLCAISDGVITLRGERSRYFGPGPATTTLTRAADNVTSDLYFKSVSLDGLLDQPSADVRQMVRGYAAGYSAYVSERHPTSCPEIALPITEQDVYRRVHAWSTLMTSSGNAGGIVAAAPGTTANSSLAELAKTTRDMSGPGSNAIVLGREATKSKRGIAVVNPHLPWHGDVAWDMVQLTIPGRINVSGATFTGTPFVIAGATQNMAWTGTIADAVIPATLFELKLTDPTTYLVDGKPERMRREDVTIQVKQPDGTLKPVTKPRYSTRYGPVITNAYGLELPWTSEKAYAFGDPNSKNMRFLNTMAEFAKAQNVRDFTSAVHRTQGNPLFNMMAADATGRTVYSGQSVIPNVPDSLLESCSTQLGRETVRFGLAALDGSRGDCAWRNDKDAIQQGIFGPGNLPEQYRNDYAVNSNESYWLTNAREPMKRLNRLVGSFETARNVRTRDTLTEVHDGLGKFDLTSTQDLVFSNRVFAAELTVDSVVTMCRTLPGMGNACDALAKWDRRANVDSRGALLFSRFWTRIGRNPDWKVPFDVKDPVRTPNTLNTANPVVVKAFTDAVAELNAAGIPFDAPLGEHQYVERDGKRIPFGGSRPETGTFNVIASEWDNGYHSIGQGRVGTNSSGYVRVVAFNGTQCPDARAVVSYQQPELFSRKQWITERFCERDIMTSPALKILRLNAS